MSTAVHSYSFRYVISLNHHSPLKGIFDRCSIRSIDLKGPTLVLRRVLLPGLYSKPPRNTRILFPHEGITLLVHLDSIVPRVNGQLLSNPANRPGVGVQQSVMPSLHLGNRCWRRERKGR